MSIEKIILDLCGGIGAWSKPYKDAGYDVRVITLPEKDVQDYVAPEEIYGILAAPPCTMFSFARTKAKNPRDLRKAMDIVYGCLRIIWQCQEEQVSPTAKHTRLRFWALENPNGLLKHFLGRPTFIFDPWNFGDMYKKQTHLWGWFNEPLKNVTLKPNLPKFGSDKDISFRFDTAKKSITPPGFAKAFFEANQ